MVDGQVAAARKTLDNSKYNCMSLIKGDTCLFSPYSNAKEKDFCPHPYFTYRNDPLNLRRHKNKIDIEQKEGVDFIFSYYALKIAGILEETK